MKRPASIVIDSNLLVLLIAGMASRAYIGRHKKLKEFSEHDFDLLVEVMGTASRVIVTPNTLTETSNLVAMVGEPIKTEMRQVMRLVVERCIEMYVPSHDAMVRNAYLWLGLTDAALLELRSPETALLTTDGGLHRQALAAGMKSTNFNALRDQYY